MNHYSPLRYPGGKSKLTKFLMDTFDKNSLCDGRYVEPYAGGASVALSLLINEYVSRIVINDLDRSIYSFWYSVLNNTDELSKMIYDAKLTLNNWKVQKRIQEEKSNADLLELGFSTFFLNRTNRSGIIKAGVIGGQQQTGKYKIDARYNKQDLVERVKTIANYKDRINLYNLDANVLVSSELLAFPKKTLIYFDPPYYVKGKDLYVNHYKHDDHVRVSKMIKSIKNHYWMITYDDVSAINNLYHDCKTVKYTLGYSLKNATKGKEILIHHEDLRIPPIKYI